MDEDIVEFLTFKKFCLYITQCHFHLLSVVDLGHIVREFYFGGDFSLVLNKYIM